MGVVPVSVSAFAHAGDVPLQDALAGQGIETIIGGPDEVAVRDLPMGDIEDNPGVCGLRHIGQKVHFAFVSGRAHIDRPPLKATGRP